MHPSKLLLFTAVKDSGKDMDINAVHPLKALSSIVVNLLFKLTAERAVHLLKTDDFIEVRVSGKDTDINAVHPLKASDFISVKVVLVKSTSI